VGLIHPRSVEDWTEWERSRHRVRAVKAAVVRRVRPSIPPSLVLHQRGGDPSVLVALDVPRGTSVEALLAPLPHYAGSAAVLTRGSLPAGLLPGTWSRMPLAHLSELPSTIRRVLSAGAFDSVSLPVHGWARQRDVEFLVVQHGLLTPFAPPLPEASHLLAWSEEDAAFWAEGRPDVNTSTVGSQLLWRAAQRPLCASSGRAVFLGQLHGVELPRLDVARVSSHFCRMTHAEYRPHPGERDMVSRALHEVWRRTGVEFEASGLPLAELPRPVVSIFSTGILEAAAQGRPAWGVHPEPPSWLLEVWARYGIGRWGGEPTRALAEAEEPARVIAGLLGA
jgi:hypothetical protein